MLIPEQYRERYDNLARSHPWMREMREAVEADAGNRECQPMRDLEETCEEYERIVNGLTAERDALARDLRECEERTQDEQRVLDMWPEFEDGQKVQVGDVSEFGKIGSITFSGYPRGVVVFSTRDAVIGTEEWGIKPCAGTKLKRPPLLAGDGLPIEIGQTLYGESDGKAWTVGRIDRGHNHPVMATCGGKERGLKPEWLSHEPPDSAQRIISDHTRDVCHIIEALGVKIPEEFAIANREYVDRIEKLAGRS